MDANNFSTNSRWFMVSGGLKQCVRDEVVSCCSYIILDRNLSRNSFRVASCDETS